ncbi:MGH1-like glycoside hydrolase domain-containing protein [Massilia sp.]|uniref:MGH1-like glycoside hydrolase domain-containing protein n=1 Tax=Massilia sp. TaxID=1882437 RepID=UPI0028A845DC|nr:esterase [Massilia sp.]
MSSHRWLLGAALFTTTAAAVAADPGLLRQAFYVRGGFNGWSLEHPLAHQGGGIYRADVLVSPGNHGFKLGSKDWSQEWVPDAGKSIAVQPGATLALDTQAGPEATLFVRSTGTYRFTLDARQPQAPTLTVTRLDSAAHVAQADPHAGHARVATLAWPTWDGKRETARFSLADPAAPLRSYTHSSTMQLRDPVPQHASYAERADRPYTRTGNLAFDALFALAGSEMAQDAVSAIRDGNYDAGAAIPCDCFETGDKWHYVWTRDLSYAADLGLALLDPARVRNSLDFKLAGWRAAVPKAPQVPGTPDGLQIVQDTGSGGSWPVSTDRTTWAFAAEEVLRTLPPAERQAFAVKALQALSNTIEIDRVAAFDPSDGLYTGEQSFLDWRDQSYAGWIVDDLASMASAKSVSTNATHYQALKLAAKLAREQGDAARATRYDGWALELKRAVNAKLWLADEGMYSSLTAAHFDGAPMHKFDWLGQSLAIVTGIADEAQARSILARYPHGPMGPPVIWPQQQGAPVYHNRAMWPFVTGYGLKAAVIGKNASVADAAYESLMRGAALNISNMENLEWLSGQPLLLDERHPELIGPVINSRRQLWSVGAYIGMVVEQVFGVAATNDGIVLDPFVTAKLRRETFKDTDQVTLHNLRLRGQRIAVRLLLPKASAGDGYYTVASILHNGAPSSASIPWATLRDGDTVEIRLGALAGRDSTIRRVNADPYVESPVVFAPREPAIGQLERGADGGTRLRIDAADNDADKGAGTVYNVYRDGKLVAARVPAGAWTDREIAPNACYAVEAQFSASGNRSHHSVPRCAAPATEIKVTDPRVQSNLKVAPASGRYAAPRLADWGQPTDRFEVRDVQIDQAGDYRVQVRYHNGANQINLGISGGVKWLAVLDARGKTVAQGVVQLPHAKFDKTHTPAVLSTPLSARLQPGAYSLRMSDFYNMSYLQSNASFSGAGGTAGPWNRIDIVGIRLQRVQ